MGDDIEDLDLAEFLERFYELEIQAHHGETFEGIFALIEHEVELARGDIDDDLKRWENEGMLESDFWKDMLRDLLVYQRELRRPRVVRAYNEHLRNIVEDNDAYAQLSQQELQAINKWRADYHRIDTALQALINEIKNSKIPDALGAEANAADPGPVDGNDPDEEDPMDGSGPPRKMTDKEKEAARKLKEKLSKSAKGAETEEEKADREKVAAEAKRTGKLRDTEEGREQLEQELYAKEAKRQKAEDTADTNLRDITGKNREAKEEMRKQANRPEVKAANAVRDLGKTGVKELLKIAGVDDDRAGKITEGIDHVLTKGNLDHEGVNAAKDVAMEKARDFAKDAFNKGVANRKKLFENDKKEDNQPAVGSREMPAEVNVHIDGPGANVPSNVPGIAAAAAAGGEVAQSNIPPNVPPVAPGNPSTTSSPANLGGSGMPKRARSDSGSDDDTHAVVRSMPRRGEYHMEGGSMHMHAQNRVYGGGIGNWSLPSLKDPSVAKYFAGVGEQVKKAFNPNLAERTNELIDNFGYASYDAKTAKFLREHGSEEVTTLTVRRAPVGSMLHTALNAISLGTWNKTRNEFGYDKLYHLGLIINRRYITQRLSRVTVTLKDADSPGSEFMEVDLRNNANELFTLKSMLQKTEKSVGPNVFFKYDSFKNNCQNFVLNILVANGLNNQALQQFILQPVDELLKAQPEYMQTVTNTLTNLGQITGAGKSAKTAMKGSGAKISLMADPTRVIENRDEIIQYMKDHKAEVEAHCQKYKYFIKGYVSGQFDEGYLVVYEENGKNEGFAFAYIDGNEPNALYLDLICTDKGRGIGTILLNRVEDTARRLNLEQVTLQPGSDYAQKFYEDNGYSTDDKYTTMYKNLDSAVEGEAAMPMEGEAAMPMEGEAEMHGSGKEDDAAAEKREYEADPGRPATNRAPVQPKSSSEYVRGEKLLTDMRTSKYADPDSDDAKHASWKSYYTSMDTLHKKMKSDTVEENKQLFTRMSELIFEYLKSLRSNRASA
jgi:GNAT superfamily N-acetyltransferase